ncbi:MAG: hypothetical protein JNK81_11735 [Anaerolineales bacterium]|nr:hypothetical protein [Anaerolineales bacterium]
MSQRKKTAGFIAILLLFAFITPIFISGFINVKNAERANHEGDYKTASDFYAQAAKIFFWQNDLWEQAGIASAQVGDYPKAIFYFQKVNQFSEQGWAWLGTSYFQTGEIEKAISTFEMGVQEFQSATLYRLLASAYRTQKNWEAEKNALESQIQLDFQDAYAHYRLGVLLMIFYPNEAFDKLNRASTLNVEVDSATETLVTALSIADTQNNQSDKYVTIGRALGLVQEWDLALFAFEKAIESNNQNAEAWAWLGEAKQQLGQDGSADLDKALSLNLKSATVRGLRALYWGRQSNYARALIEYSLANQIEPTNPAWLAGMGEAHAKLGDLIAALEAYQHAIEFAPDDPIYWRLLAMFCADNNFYIEEIGLPAAEQAVSLSPNDATNLDALGYVYFLSGRYSNAEITLLQAIEFSPQYFPAHLHLALTYLAQGNRPAAYNALTYVRDADVSGVYRPFAQQLLNQYFP